MRVSVLHVKSAFLSVLFTLLLSVAGVTNAMAQTFTEGNLNYSLNDDGVSVTVTGHVDGTAATGELVIPESVELYGTTYFVTVIGNGAFSGCDYLTGSLVIPNSVITIGEWAFQNCFNLNGSLTIGNSVVNIEVGAFRSCNFTGELTIPASVKRIGYWAFGWNEFTILNYNATYVNFLHSEWLIGCSSFTTLNIGENVQMIPNDFVAGNVDFTNELIIPNSVTFIGANSFNSCTGFTGSLSIPNSVTSIGENAFNGCSGFTGSLSIPNSVSSIGTNAFSGCSGFSGTLTLGNSVTQIGNSAFFGACENFTSFDVLAEIPPALGTNVFTSIDYSIPMQVPCGSMSAYQSAEGWSSFTNMQEPNPCMWEITATANPVEGGTVSGGGTYEQGTTCTLTATPAEGYEFLNWKENGTVVSTDAEYSFIVTSNRDLVAHFTNPNYIVFADPNVEARCVELWDSDGDGFLSYDEAAAVTSLGHAFEYWGITSFDELQYFTGLTYLNNYEFYECGNLSSITLPENISYIYYAAFAECYNLSSITVLANMPPQIEDSWSVFYGVDRSIPVAVPCGTTSSYQNAYGWNAFSNYQESNDCIYEITAIVNHEGAGMVNGAGSYQKGETCTLVATPNEGRTFVRWIENGQEVSTEATYSFTVMGSRNLMACFSSLASEIIVFADDNVKSICVNHWDTDGDGELSYEEAAVVTDLSLVFYCNESITSFDELQYFTGLTTINYAFYKCFNLTSIIIPEGVVTIGEYAFYSCGLRGELTLPESLELIGEYAFYGCDGISTVNYNAINCQTTNYADEYPIFSDCAFTHLNIGENVQSIPNFVFKRCSSVTNIIVAAVNPPTIYPGTFGMVPRNILVSVPYGSGEAYRTAPYWEEFFNITEDYSSSPYTYHWNVNAHQFGDNMTVTGIIQIEGMEQAVPSLEIGAFCNGQCRGRQLLTYYPQVDRYLVFLMLYGEDGDVFTFKLYDHEAEEELTAGCASVITFETDAIVGTFLEPYVFNFTDMQLSQFSEGYNWWSTYVEQSGINGLEMLQQSLGSNGITIRSQASGYTDYYEGYGWYGSLASINNESSYRVITSAPCVAMMAGSAAVPSEHPITLGQGWTWMGYLPSTAMDINDALAGLEAILGDKVKSQHGYSDYYPGYGWFGSLNTIEPGMGLMYYSASGEPVTFTYPDNSRGGVLKENLIAENNHWVPNTYAYPDNMTVMAVIDLNDEELKSDNYELAAFANGECRGSVKLTYAEPINRHVAFLTVSGKDATELNFRLYDTKTGMEYYDAEENLTFTANAIVGDADNLLTIHFRGTTGMDEFANSVKVYPNPVNTGERFSIVADTESKAPVRVEIVNTLGAVVSVETSTQAPVSIEAPTTAGVYTLRITCEEGTCYRKIVVR